mgnify:CR=1 FL=1
MRMTYQLWDMASRNLIDEFEGAVGPADLGDAHGGHGAPRTGGTLLRSAAWSLDGGTQGGQAAA